MKQQFFIIACLLAHTCYADTLSDAIQSNNLDLVSSLLQQNRLTPKLGYLYLSKADETIRICREQVLLFEIRPQIDPEGVTYTFNPLLFLPIPIVTFYLMHINAGPAAHCTAYAAFVFITMCVGIAQGVEGTKKNRQKRYNNALKIKDLILEYYGNNADKGFPSF